MKNLRLVVARIAASDSLLVVPFADRLDFNIRRVFKDSDFGLLSRICGLILVQEGVPTCDRARFPSLRRCETHRIV